MLRIRQLVSAFVLLVAVGATGWAVARARTPEPLPEGSAMPEFAFRTEAGPATLRPSGDRPFLLIWFHTECRYCRVELDEIQNRLEDLGGVQLTLLSPEDSLFSWDLPSAWPGLWRHPDVTWGIAEGARAQELLGLRLTPTLLLFDTAGILRRRWVGETRVDAVLEQVGREVVPGST